MQQFKIQRVKFILQRVIFTQQNLTLILALITFHISGEIQEATGSLQLGSGQTSGIEAAVHAMHEAYNDDSVQAILLVDASNAFNSFNPETALRNIQHLCPSLATILINTYRQPARSNLYVDGDTPERGQHRAIC